jgi:hypothetical protein
LKETARYRVLAWGVVFLWGLVRLIDTKSVLTFLAFTLLRSRATRFTLLLHRLLLLEGSRRALDAVKLARFVALIKLTASEVPCMD